MIPDTVYGAILLSVIDFFLSFVVISGIGPNLAGVFGTAISGGIMLALLGVQ